MALKTSLRLLRNPDKGEVQCQQEHIRTVTGDSEDSS